MSGPAFVGGGTAMITLVAFTYFVLILPSIQYSAPSLWLYITRPDYFFDFALSVYLTFCIYFNYYMCIKTDPGSPTFPASADDHLQAKGQTTLENMVNRRDAKDYNLGWRKNFEVILGKGDFWFSGLLPSTRPPRGDGCYFATRQS
eukprot:gene6793-7898_t